MTLTGHLRSRILSWKERLSKLTPNLKLCGDPSPKSMQLDFGIPISRPMASRDRSSLFAITELYRQAKDKGVDVFVRAALPLMHPLVTKLRVQMFAKLSSGSEE
jgi:hypothetical protein